MLKKTNSLFALSLVLLLTLSGCSDSGSKIADQNTADAQITLIDLPDTSAKQRYMFTLDYHIEAEQPMEDVFVSFYLHSSSLADEGNNEVSFKTFIGSEIIDVLSVDNENRRLEMRIPSVVEPGDYYIEAFINEDLEGEGNETPYDFRNSQLVTVEDETQSVTALRIVDVELENHAVILDPYVDFLRGLEVNNVLALMTSDMATERQAWMTSVIQGLASEAEINGSVTVAVDGQLPAEPMQLYFEYSLDSGASWQALEWWDNTEQSYQLSAGVAFPDWENGTYEQTVDFDINIAHTLLQSLFEHIAANGTAGLEGYTGWQTRIRFAAAGAEATEQLTLPLYAVPISLEDLALITGYMNEVQDCLADLALCALINSGGGIPVPAGLKQLEQGAPAGGDVLQSKTAARADETADRVSEKNWERWSGKRKRVKIGAEYQHKFAIYNGNPREGYYGAYAKMAFESPLYIFNHKANLIDAYVRASAYMERPDDDELRYTGYQYYLKLFADTVFWGEQWAGNASIRAGSIDPISLQVRNPDSVLYKKPLKVQKRYLQTRLMVGPVPFKIEGGVKGQLDYGIALNIDQSEGIKLTTALPKTTMKLYAEGGPDIIVRGAGVGTDLGIFDNTLTSSIEFDFHFDQQQKRMTGAQYDVVVKDDLKTIWGEFYLYYFKFVCKPPESVVDLPDCNWKRRQRTLFKTDPYRDWSYTLYSQSQTLFEY